MKERAVLYQDRHLDLVLVQDQDDASMFPATDEVAAASERRVIVLVALAALVTIALAVRAAIGQG